MNDKHALAGFAMCCITLLTVAWNPVEQNSIVFTGAIGAVVGITGFILGKKSDW